MEFMRDKPDGYFELAIVDPPYGINKGGGVDWGTNTITKHKAKEWDNEIPNKDYFIELFRISQNQIIWGGNYFIEYLKNTPCMLIWDKMNGTNNMADCELAWTSFTSPVRKFTRHIFSGIGNTNYHLETIHPTQKPTQLYKWILKNYAISGNKILDTHLGSGSSRIACYDGGFDFWGCELDKDYFEAMEKRFQNHIKQLTFELI